MNTLQKVLIYSNPIGWCVGVGIFIAIKVHNTGRDIKKTAQIMSADDDCVVKAIKRF